MDNSRRLGPHELVPNRPFANPGRLDQDCLQIVSMITAANLARGRTQRTGRPVVGSDRLVITEAGRAHGDNPVAIVGFFGERRPDGTEELANQIEEINAQMVAGFEQFPMLLVYVSRLLADGLNYANLVVLSAEEGIAAWRDLPIHQPAAAELSPRFYSSVRIYNGAIPCGLSCTEHLALRVVKYWDFNAEPTWHSERSLEPIVPGD